MKLRIVFFFCTFAMDAIVRFFVVSFGNREPFFFVRLDRNETELCMMYPICI